MDVVVSYWHWGNHGSVFRTSWCNVYFLSFFLCGPLCIFGHPFNHTSFTIIKCPWGCVVTCHGMIGLMFSCGVASGVCSSSSLATMSSFGNAMAFCVMWGWGIPFGGGPERPSSSSRLWLPYRHCPGCVLWG